MKRQYDTAVRGGAFREYRERGAVAHRCGHALIDLCSMMTAAAYHEQRAGAFRKPANYRPARDFRFGDKPCRPHRIDRKWIEPRYVIGDQQHRRATGNRRPLDFDIDCENVQQLRRPALDAVRATRFFEKRKDEGCDRDTASQVQRDTDQPKCANNKVCCINDLPSENAARSADSSATSAASSADRRY